MDYGTFLAHAGRGQLPTVVLLHGADAQLLDDALAAATRALFPDAAGGILDREVLDGETTRAEEIVRSALTLPLAAPRRLVAVRHCQALAATEAPPLARYVADPNPSTCLVLLAEETLRATRDRKADHWLLGVIPAPAVVELPVARGRALEAWLRQRALAEGLTVSDEAAGLLVEWVGEDAATLLGEVRKAALAGGPDNRAVGRNEVTAVVGAHRLSGVFDLTRAIERRDAGLALRTLDRLLASEDALAVLSMLTREVRTAWTVAELSAAGAPVGEIVRKMGRPQGVVEALVRAGAPPETCARRLRRCWEVETRLKSGGESRAEMAVLVAELCGAG